MPAALTVCSGSALAASSTSCLAFATSTASAAPLFDAGTTTPPTSFPDTFSRVQLLRSPTVLSGAFLLSRAALGSFPVAPSLWSAGTNWQRFGVVTGPTYDRLFGNQETGALPSDAVPSQFWVALRFDAQGNIVGAGLSGSGSVVGSSCWTSLATSG